MAQNDHSDVYIIPPNFVKEGTLFSGRAESRNVVEAAFLALVGIRFLVFLNLGIKGKIYVVSRAKVFPLFLSSCFHIL